MWLPPPPHGRSGEAGRSGALAGSLDAARLGCGRASPCPVLARRTMYRSTGTGPPSPPARRTRLACHPPTPWGHRVPRPGLCGGDTPDLCHRRRGLRRAKALPAQSLNGCGAAEKRRCQLQRRASYILLLVPSSCRPWGVLLPAGCASISQRGTCVPWVPLCPELLHPPVNSTSPSPSTQIPGTPLGSGTHRVQTPRAPHASLCPGCLPGLLTKEGPGAGQGCPWPGVTGQCP